MKIPTHVRTTTFTTLTGEKITVTRQLSKCPVGDDWTDASRIMTMFRRFDGSKYALYEKTAEDYSRFIREVVNGVWVPMLRDAGQDPSKWLTVVPSKNGGKVLLVNSALVCKMLDEHRDRMEAEGVISQVDGAVHPRFMAGYPAGCSLYGNTVYDSATGKLNRKQSKMECMCEEVLKLAGVRYVSEYTDETLVHKNKLRIDFVILDDNGSVTHAIELNGRHHERPVTFGGMSQDKADALHEGVLVRDQIKRDWLNDRGIGLIEMDYRDREFSHRTYKANKWFTQRILTELHTHGVIDWQSFSDHSEPWEPSGEPSRTRFLPAPVEAAGIDRDGTGMLQSLLF